MLAAGLGKDRSVLNYIKARRLYVYYALLIISGCAGNGSAYVDVPMSEPKPASERLQEAMGLKRTDVVLAEITPDSYISADHSPTVAFAYEPYQIVTSCEGRIRVVEQWEYGPGPTGVELTSNSHRCGSSQAGRLVDRPSQGQRMLVHVYENPDELRSEDWSVAIIADRSLSSNAR